MMKNLSLATATFVLVAALGTASLAGNHANTPGSGAADAGAANADRDTPSGDASVGGDASDGRSDAGADNADGAQPEDTGLGKAKSEVCSVGQAADGCAALGTSN